MSEPTPRPIQFGTQFAVHQSGPLTQELADNLYLEKAPAGSKFQYVLLGSPGLAAYASTQTARVRGMHPLGSYLFAVVGDKLYRISSSAAVDEIGSIGGSGPVTMAENGVHLWIATSGPLYAANASELIQLPESNMVGVAYQDGYMLGFQRGPNQFMWISGLDDATTIGGADFTSVDTFSDEITGGISDHREVYVMKERSTEVFYNSGAADFPFERSQVIERGCVAPYSIDKAQSYVYWLADDLQVYRMIGYQPELISTEVVTAAIEADTSPQTAFGFCHQQGGHTFYTLTLASITLQYNSRNGLWNTRTSDGLDYWRASAYAYMKDWRKHMVGDISTGDILEMSKTAYDENGNILRRRAVGTPIWANGNRFVVDQFFLDIDAGVGLVTGQGSDPKAVLEWSNDGGRTFNGARQRSIGKIGEYGARARWHSCGTHRNWMPRITITDPVPVRINGAYVRTQELAS